jgi:hypothetical protein
LFLHIGRHIKEREEKLVKYFYDKDIIQSVITDNRGAHVFIYPTFDFFEIGAIIKLHPRSVIGPHSLVKDCMLVMFTIDSSTPLLRMNLHF